jgi:Ca2+-binding EF-hand superfamily protein
MRVAFQKLGFNVPLAEIRKAISAHDSGKDGMIDFEEFKIIFRLSLQPEEESKPVVPVINVVLP